MKSRSLFALSILFGVLSACSDVDMAGLSAESSRKAKGPDSASVTVTEYADLQCPACASAHKMTNQPLLEKYGNSIRLEFKHFPLRHIHQYAYEAAQASECAADQGKFWEFVDINYANQSRLSSSVLREWAQGLAVDVSLFDRCVRSEIKGKTVMADMTEGQNLGVNSTPTYFVNGKKVEGNNFAAVSTAIEEAMNVRL